MRRAGSTTQVLVAVVALLLLGGGGAVAFWWWSAKEHDPRAQEVVGDAESVVAAYYVAQPHPKLGNWERMTGSGFDRVSFGEPPIGEPPVEALRAIRTAHFTNGFSGNHETLELLLLIVPPQAGEAVSTTTIRSITNEGRQFVLVDPLCRR